MASIIYTDYFIPEKVSIEQLFEKDLRPFIPEAYDSPVKYCQFLRETLGIGEIGIGDVEDSADIYSSLIAGFIKESKIDPAEVSYIVTAGWNPLLQASRNEELDFYTDGVNVPYYLHKKFGFVNAKLLNLEHYCSGSTYALGLASSLLDKNGEYMIILTASFVPRIDNRFKFYTICGDGVGIFVVSRRSVGLDIIDFDSVTMGHDSYNKYEGSPERLKAFGRQFHAADLVKSLLAQNGLTLSDVHMIIPHNVNSGVNYLSAKFLGIPLDKIFSENTSKTGHLLGVDIMVNLKDYMNSVRIPDGAYLLITAASNDIGGSTFQTVLLRYNPNQSLPQ